jgi:hypothetical protein
MTNNRTTLRKLKLQVQMSVDGYIAGLMVKWTGWFGTGMINSKNM